MTTHKTPPLPKVAIIAVVATAAVSAAAFFGYRFYMKQKADQEAAEMPPPSAPPPAPKDWATMSKDLYAALGPSGMKAMARAGLELSETGQTASNLQAVASRALGDAYAKASAKGLGFAQAGTRLLGVDTLAKLNNAKIAVRSSKVSAAGSRPASDNAVIAVIGLDVLKGLQGKLLFVQAR